MASPLYKQIAAKEEFRGFILDILARMGLVDKDLDLLFSPKSKEINYGEFAKCFVTKQADPNYNYEVYELAGDVCLNNSIVMYFLSNINSAQEQRKARDPHFKPSPMLTDYFNKLKAHYISKFYFKDLYYQFGFHQFLKQGNDLKNEPDKCYSDSFEAFIGCFEVLCDRHLDDHYSHRYVSNFIKYIFNMKNINYNPSLIYEPITLLKETNDAFKKRYHYKYLIKNMGGRDSHSQLTTLHFIKGSGTGENDKDYEHYGDFSIVKYVAPMSGHIKNNNEEMSRRVLNYLSSIASGIYEPDKSAPDYYMIEQQKKFKLEEIKLAPSPELLGIEELMF